MARIFTAMFNMGRDPIDFEKMPPFLEAFISGLKDAGNCVLCFQHKTFGREFNNELPEDYSKMITDFNPELCILFCNNFWDISKLIECPIVIYDIDSILEFRGVEHLKENIDRYLFVVNQTAGIQPLKEYLLASDKQIFHIPFFSEIHATNVNIPLHDINFLGTNWAWKGYDFVRSFTLRNPSEQDRLIAKKILREYTEDPIVGIQEIINKNDFHPQMPLIIQNDRRAVTEISGIRRLRFLSAVADLDLEIRGNYWNIDCLKYFPEVALCYNDVRTVSLSENEMFYNSAKLSLNTKHVQAQNGFSFRVCDIMASNACLVTESCSDLEMLFPKVPLPVFNSVSELREQCINLLNDESRRREIVYASQEVIDNGHRFKHVLAHLEKITGLSLVSVEPGNVTFFSDESNNNQLEHQVVPQKPYLFFDRNRVANHLGYGPAFEKKQKNLKFGPFVFRAIKTENGVLDLYVYFIPLLRIRTNQNKGKVRILFLEKVKTLFMIYIDKILFAFKKDFSVIKKKIHRTKLRNKWDKGEKIKIVLFVSRISCWLFGDLYKLLNESSHFEPIIVIKPFVSQGKEAMIRYQETTYDALITQGYQPIMGYDIDRDEYLDVRKYINPDIVFYTKFWKPHFHPNFYIDKFLDKLTFFTPYGFYVAEDSKSMNFELNNLVDRFFLATPIHKEIADRDMDNRGKNVYITGGPKLDIFFDKEYKVKVVWKKQDRPKKKIIWAPHHEDHTTNEMYQFDSFYEMADFMLALAKEYKEEVQFAFKPHPMLKEKLYIRWGIENTDRYYQKWMENENCQLEEGEFADLFLGSDAMILDSISFIAEYTAVNKPALFTIGRKARVLLNEYGQKNREILYEAQGDLETGVKEFIDNVVIRGLDYKAEERDLFIKEHLLPPYGKTASQNIYDNICEEIKRK